MTQDPFAPTSHQQPASNHLVLIDDDSSILHDYAKGLRLFCRDLAGFDITCCEQATEAIAFCERVPSGDGVIVIVDSMLPYGDVFTEEETEGGQLTGIALIRRLQNRNGGAGRTLFIMLTNFERTGLSRRLEDLDIPVRLCPKIKYPPRKFAEVVDLFIAQMRGEAEALP